MRRPHGSTLVPLMLGMGLALSSACSSDPCLDTFTALCEKACSCGTDDACRIGSEDTGFFIEFQSLQDCTGLYELGCAAGGPPAGFDYGACSDDIAAAACWTSNEGEEVLEEPTACDG